MPHFLVVLLLVVLFPPTLFVNIAMRMLHGMVCADDSFRVRLVPSSPRRNRFDSVYAANTRSLLLTLGTLQHRFYLYQGPYCTVTVVIPPALDPISPRIAFDSGNILGPLRPSNAALQEGTKAFPTRGFSM